MIHFIIKSTLCVGLLFSFYKLFLEGKRMYRFNRFYLIGMLLLSMVIPSLVISMENPITNIHTFSIVNSTSFINLYFPYLLAIYIVVFSVLMARFIGSLTAVFLKIRNNQHIKTNNGTIVLVNEKILPHTFLGYVFINFQDYYTNKIEAELFTHEFAHATEKHTLDVLFTEVYKIVFWFNPLVYLIKKSIQLNHEFIADELVIKTHQSRNSYQTILLNVATWNNQNYLTSNLNYGVTKQRFNMMTRKTSVWAKRILKIIVIPVIILSLFLFADVVQNTEHISDEHSTEISHSKNEHSESSHRD